MANKALLVGINAYPGCPLRGCVNDVLNMANYLVKYHGFKHEEIRLLTDERATTKEIGSRLKWLTTGNKAEDKIVFHYSGHGAQVATRNTKEELDGMLEVICPVDFDWSPKNMLTDKQLNKIFKKVPKTAHAVWVSDSCHSGDLSRFFPHPHEKPKTSKAFKSPACINWRNEGARLKEYVPEGLGDSTLNLAFISGCRDNQTSADTEFDGKPCGALTHYLLEVLTNEGKDRPITEVVKLVNARLSANGYDQEPQAEGGKANLAFLG